MDCYPDNAIWPDPDVLTPPADATPEELERFELELEITQAKAWGTLQALSGYQLALCPVTVRPARKGCNFGSYYIDWVGAMSAPMGSPFFPRVQNGVWINVWCGHDGSCGCEGVREVVLPGSVGDIDQVLVDGDIVPATAYRVDNGNRLVRTDGLDWPLCQDFNKPDTEVGTFSVTYYDGAIGGAAIRYAAGVLADEYLKAIQGKKCRLPSGTTQIVRQGLTIEVDPNMFSDGRTGISEVDDVILRLNPFRLKMPPEVFSLDKPRARTTTWGG